MRKYRIVIGESSKFPYRIEERKTFLFIPYWSEIDMEADIETARSKMKRIASCRIPPKGTIVEEYDEKDLLADKLKGKA